MLKVVFHVDELERWPMVLINAKNFLNAEPDSQIVILANAAAVVFYQYHSSSLEKIRFDLKERGVRFKACRNALKENQIPEDSLTDSIQIVPAGVVELARLQQEGFAYIRP